MGLAYYLLLFRLTNSQYCLLLYSLDLKPLLGTRKHRSYYAVIAVGSINFRVALDTASSDLWIASTACGTKACKPLPKYPLTYRSPSFIPVNDNSTAFNVSYADGTCERYYHWHRDISYAVPHYSRIRFCRPRNSAVIKSNRRWTSVRSVTELPS
jgi:hypothetical protein